MAARQQYEVGATYRSAYWGKHYTVIQLHGPGVISWSNWAVTVRWEDGSTTTHCTALDRRDKKIITVESQAQ